MASSILPGRRCAFSYIAAADCGSASAGNPDPRLADRAPIPTAFNENDYQWLGFDLDHAVARYHVQPLLRLIYAAVAKAMVEICGYPTSVFTRRVRNPAAGCSNSPSAAAGEPGWVTDWCNDGFYDASFMQKGLIFDFRTGDLIKLDVDGRIVAGWHGHRALTEAELDAKYGTAAAPATTAPAAGTTPATAVPGDDAAVCSSNRIWCDFHLLKDQKKHPDAFVLMTYFDMPAQLTLCQCVAAVDDGTLAHFEATAHSDKALTSPSSPWQASSTPDPAGSTPSASAASTQATAALPGHQPDPATATSSTSPYKRLMTDHIAAFNHIFDNVSAFPSGRGGFFQSLKDSPTTYLHERPRLAAWLRSLRSTGSHHTFLATNSHLEFATFALEFCLGPDWRSCFDVLIFNSLKPAFFSRTAPFHRPDGDRRSDGEISGHLHMKLKLLQGFGRDGTVHAPSSFSSSSTPLVPTSTSELLHVPEHEYCQGNAAAIQALADASRWLQKRAERASRSRLQSRQSDGSAADGSRIDSRSSSNGGNDATSLVRDDARVVTATASSATAVRSGAGAAPFIVSSSVTTATIMTVTIHVDEKGHVMQATATDGPVPSTTDEASAAIVDGSTSSSGSTGASQSVLTQAQLATAHRTIVIPLPPQHGAASESTTAVLLAAQHPAHVNPDSPLHQVRSEPATIASQLLDELSSPIDEATGEVMEAGGIRAAGSNSADSSFSAHARILYVGDHMHGDITAARKECGWDTLAVVEECEVDLPNSSHAGLVPVQVSSRIVAPAEQTAAGQETSLGDRNWPASYADECPWGSFWTAGPIAGASGRISVGGGLGSLAARSYFCALLESHATAVVADVETMCDIA